MKARLLIAALFVSFAVSGQIRDYGALMASAKRQHQQLVNFNTLPDFRLWLEASTAGATNTTHAGVILDGEAVTRFRDLSTNNYNFSAQNANDGVIYHSSGGAGNQAYFSVTNGLQSFSTTLFANSNFTAVFVMKVINPGTGGAAYIIGNSTSGLGAFARWQKTADSQFGTNTFTMYNNGSTFPGYVNKAITNAWCLATFIWNNASSEIRTNGVSMLVGTTGVNNSLQATWTIFYAVGTGSSGLSMRDGGICRVLIFARPLTATELSQVEARCKADFGL